MTFAAIFTMLAHRLFLAAIAYLEGVWALALGMGLWF